MGYILETPAAQVEKHPPERTQRACPWRALALPLVSVHRIEGEREHELFWCMQLGLVDAGVSCSDSKEGMRCCC